MNCVLIVIDGLARADLELVRQHCPTLSRLMATGDRYENVYANGCPTEFALPGLFAADWLLDNSDRWAGLSNKKLTAAEYFASKSFACGSFSPVYRPASNSYRRGYTHFYNPFCPRTLAKEIEQLSNWYLDEYLAGRLAYEGLESNVLDLLNESVTGMAGLDPYFGIDAGVIEALRTELREHPARVVEEFARSKNLRILQVLNESIQTRVMSQRNRPSVLFLYAVMAFMALVYGGSKRMKLTYAGIVRLFGPRRSKSKFSSAETLVDEYVDWLERQTAPTFAFLHLLDFHEKNYFRFETGTVQLGWLARLLRFLISNRHQMDRIHHLMSLLYTDHQVDRVLSAIERRGDHAVVLTSDHGNIDFSKDRHVFHKTFDFSDRYYGVPLVIYRPGSAGTANGNLGSSIDVVPTLIWDLFSEEDARFAGLPLQKRSRDYVFFENTGRGPVDLTLKPVYIALKRETTKIKFRCYLSSEPAEEAVLCADLLDVRDGNDKFLPFSTVTRADLAAIVARMKQVYTGIGRHPTLARLQVGSQVHELSLHSEAA